MKTTETISRGALAVALVLGGAQAAQAQDAPTPGVQPSSQETAAGNEIIVTGTRQTGITAAESAAPIKLVGADAISHVGQPNLNQVLTQLVPSFTAQGFGGDTANLTLSAALRGLNPNETLVLVNGKRRHGTANLQVLASAFQGGASPDLDFITPASIDHIEVLEDGASAQYGSDAIAGVINIILKKKAGGTLSATGGKYYAGDGAQYSGSLNYGFIGSRGFFNVTGFYRFHDFSNRGKYDIRVYDPASGPATTVDGSAALAAAVQKMPNYPNINYIVGDARSHFWTSAYNAGFDMTDDIHFYSFGTVGYRRAESYENVRLPDRVVGSNAVDPATGLFLPGTYDGAIASGQTNLIARPLGFEPQEGLRELDYQFVAGVKGDFEGWHWDLSTTHGSDQDKVYTLNSINRSLYYDYHNDKSNFYDGLYRTTEWTNNLDVSREIGKLGTIAAGAEYREDIYTIGAGDPDSYYKTGAQSFPGFNPLAAGNHKRHDYAFYGDVALTPIDNLKLDGAVRYEDYSDFGDKLTWKATGRYDFSPAIAIRGTAATGFRAPTLAEEWYTAVNVSPTSATAQLAANSAAAKVLGIQNLKPEKSTNYSAGLVLRPVPRFTATVDAYQIKLRDRIVGSGSISANTANPNDPVSAAIRTAGVNLEAGLPSFVSAFVNGPNTRTRGVDLVTSYDADFGNAGRAVFTLSGAYNKTKILSVPVAPAALGLPAGTRLIDAQSLSYLTSVQPHFKVIGGINWSLSKFSVTARETYYSKSVALLYNDNDLYDYSKIHPAFITDLEVSYRITDRITLTGGANNLFNKKPAKVRYDSEGVLSGDTLVGGAPYQFGPYGINGGYWYGRATVAF